MRTLLALAVFALSAFGAMALMCLALIVWRHPVLAFLLLGSAVTSLAVARCALDEIAIDNGLPRNWS